MTVITPDNSGMSLSAYSLHLHCSRQHLRKLGAVQRRAIEQSRTGIKRQGMFSSTNEAVGKWGADVCGEIEAPNIRIPKTKWISDEIQSQYVQNQFIKKSEFLHLKDSKIALL